MPFFLDEKSKHADWSADALSASCHQYWLQPEDCSIVDPEAVREFVGKLRGARFETEPGAGAIMLYQRPERVPHFILDAISDASDAGRAVSP